MWASSHSLNIADIKKTDNDDKFKVYATFYGIGIIQLIKDGFKIESGELVALEKVKEEVIYMGNLPKFFVIKIRSPRNKSKFTLKRIIIKKV